MRLTQQQIHVLTELRHLWPHRKFVLIGAAALGCQLDRFWRQTNDLDISVAIPLEEYPAGLDRLDGWHQDPQLEHRWIAPNGIALDVLPTGSAILADGQLAWPASGRVMNMCGFRHALARSVPYALGDGLTVEIAPAYVVALLKMVAYLDRPFERDRDLSDLAHLLVHYLDSNEARRFSDEFVAMQLDYDATAAFALGRDIGAVIDDPERLLVDEFIAKTKADNDPHLTHARLLRHGPTRWHEEPDEMLALLEALRRGLTTSVG